HHREIDATPRLTVLGDAARLAQVVANLLMNAAKYTPEHGHIAVHATRQGDDVVIEVRDDGQGIGPELLPHVFDLFQQGPRKPDRSEGGLGIGLALVKQLVSSHGGTVSAHSAGTGQGSSFVLRFPRAPEATSSDG